MEASPHVDSNWVQGVGKSLTTIATLGWTRDYYTFLGWNRDGSATTAEFQDGSKQTFSEDTDLYAIWKKNQYTITFNSNGGTTVGSITQDWGTSVQAPTNPTRSGFTFGGWTPACPSTMPTRNTTCTAKWNLSKSISDGWTLRSTNNHSTNKLLFSNVPAGTYRITFEDLRAEHHASHSDHRCHIFLGTNASSRDGSYDINQSNITISNLSNNNIYTGTTRWSHGITTPYVSHIDNDSGGGVSYGRIKVESTITLSATKSIYVYIYISDSNDCDDYYLINYSGKKITLKSV